MLLEDYHTKFHDPKLHGATVSPTSQIRAAVCW